ncbi:SCO2524 family protein [Nocardia amamiensis]|uniref:SCO2524 family protein n=1 Tax=Nocardia amamiensis TaxID=404578 RepID=UPI002B4B8076|nr:SCO2524 family protein [Nocardia amamiensis]
MRIQPRQQILDLWRSALSVSWDGAEWHWGGRMAANSISDSEQLLCLLYPATEIESLALDRPDSMADDVSSVLSPFGGQTKIGTVVIALLEDYILRNTNRIGPDGEPDSAGEPDGEPIFAAGSYLRSADEREPTAVQREIEVVDSYSMSLTLCLAGLRFLRVYEGWVRAEGRATLIDRIEKLTGRLSARLTAAMTGLVRSFVVNTVEPKSEAGQVMLGMLNQSDLPSKSVAEGITRSLERVRARLRNDITLGQTPDTELDDEELLFECGWSWGLVRDAAPVGFVDAAIAMQPGIADPRPYLYFTVIALDGINDLISQRTRELDLLDEQQYRLAEALRIRWDLTQRYWSTVARFGSGSWPLEDIPWRTSDGEESDYFSLIVSAVLIQDLINRTASDDDLTRAVAIFDELARRGRIIRRTTRDDPAVQMHAPGVRLSLRGTESVDDGPLLQWEVSDFAAVLLKRLLQAARLSSNITARDRLMDLAKSTMDHLEARIITTGLAAGLWDDPAGVFGNGTARETKPSWYMTERVIECLVSADRTFREPPLTSPAMVVRAVELLNEAEHLLNQEMLSVSIDDVSENRITLDRVEENLEQARQLVARRQAGTAFVLAADALRELHKLAYARMDATRAT